MFDTKGIFLGMSWRGSAFGYWAPTLTFHDPVHPLPLESPPVRTSPTIVNQAVQRAASW